MNKLLITLLLNLFLSVSIFAQKNFVPKSHDFKGVIKTQNDEVIAGANLYFKKKDDVRTFTFVTDINGDFRAELRAGNYELTVNDILSKSFKAYIKIQDEGVNANNVSFTVKANKNPCGLAGNVICPKPTSLPKPAYAAGARARKVKGEVVVKIKINSDGKVISAEAISGSEWLIPATIIAAKRAKFEQLTNVKESEIYMTYAFIGYDSRENNNLTKYKIIYRVNVEIIKISVIVSTIIRFSNYFSITHFPKSS